MYQHVIFFFWDLIGSIISNLIFSLGFTKVDIPSFLRPLLFIASTAHY